MEAYDISAKYQFRIQKESLTAYLSSSKESINFDLVLSETKEKFLTLYPNFNESKYEMFKHLAETFAKRDELSYVEFADLLENEYGYILKEIKEQKTLKNFENVNSIKNMLTFFTVLTVLSIIVYVFAFFVIG